MGNKIITEEDFWECTGGLMPVPLQSSQRLVYTNGRKAKKYITLADKSTVSWVDFGCKKLMLLYAVIAAVAAAIAALCAATGGAALIAICALAGAAGAMWGAVVGSLLCGQLAAMARVWCSSKDDFQILGINTITGKDTMQCLAFTFIGQNPETITYKPGVKSWSQALATGAANLIGGLFEGMMYGACIGSAFAAGAALAGGASAGGGLAGMGRVALNFIKSIPRNILTNIAESYSAMGMGMRGVMSAQSALTTYGELGDEMTREDLGNAVSRGFWSMETGTYESGKNILTGNGKPEDYMGLALSVAPTGQGVREVFPHDAKYQNMGIVPDNIAGKMDLDGGIKKTPDADGGVKKSVSDDGLPVKKQGSSKSRKPKGKNGKAYEKLTNKEVGNIAENLVRESLKKDGYTDVVDVQNRSGNGVDIIARNPKTGHVKCVEVKANTSQLNEHQRWGGEKYVEDRLKRAVDGKGHYKVPPNSPEMKTNAEKALEWIDESTQVDYEVTRVEVERTTGDAKIKRTDPWDPRPQKRKTSTTQKPVSKKVRKSKGK